MNKKTAPLRVVKSISVLKHLLNKECVELPDQPKSMTSQQWNGKLKRLRAALRKKHNSKTSVANLAHEKAKLEASINARATKEAPRYSSDQMPLILLPFLSAVCKQDLSLNEVRFVSDLFLEIQNRYDCTSHKSDLWKIIAEFLKKSSDRFPGLLRFGSHWAPRDLQLPLSEIARSLSSNKVTQSPSGALE